MFLLGLLFGLYKATSQPKVYEAHGRIQVRTGSSNEYRVSAVSNFGGDSSSRLQTEVNIIKSDSLLLTVARELNLVNDPNFFGTKGPPTHYSLETPAIRQAAIGTLQSNLKVILVLKTDIIEISYTDLGLYPAQL